MGFNEMSLESFLVILIVRLLEMTVLLTATDE